MSTENVTDRKTEIPPDHEVILELIGPSSIILDLGCGTGELLSLLVKEKNAKAQGIEIDDRAIFECVAKGLSVFHDDIDTGLAEYGEKSLLVSRILPISMPVFRYSSREKCR